MSFNLNLYEKTHDFKNHINEVFKEHEYDEIIPYYNKLTKTSTKIQNNLNNFIYENYETYIETQNELYDLKTDIVSQLTNKFDEMQRLLNHMQNIDLCHHTTTTTSDDTNKKKMQIDDDCTTVDKETIELFERFLFCHEYEKYMMLLDDPLLDQDIIGYYSRRLAADLLKLLRHPHIQYPDFKQTVQYLNRLGYAIEARDIFFRIQERTTCEMIKHLKYIARYDEYIEKVAEIMFTNIVNTGKKHNVLFSDLNTSEYVVWATKQIAKFIQLFGIHVHEIIDQRRIIDKCVEAAMYKHEILKDYGMDMKHVLKPKLLKFYKQ